MFVQALQRLSTFEVSGTLIAKPSSPDTDAKSKRATNKNRAIGEDIAALAGFENDVFPETNDSGKNGLDDGVSGLRESHERLAITSGQIAALFRKKPELAEFIFLEILSM